MAEDARQRKFFFDAQKRNFARCLHPSLLCDRQPIRAHSIQNSRVLDLIQENGHVLMPHWRMKDGEPVMEFARVGRNEASTFTGLCAEHDTELFKIIDIEPLNVDSEIHLALLAYRSVLRELHMTIESADRIMSVHEDFVRSGAVPADAVTPAMLVAIDFYKKAHNVFRYRSKHLDEPILAGKQPDLKHSVLELANQAPVIAVSSLFSTGYSETGDIIGPTFNVMPMDGLKMAVILSCPMEQENSVAASLSKVCQADDERLTYEISKLIIQRVENFTLSPAHFTTWSAEKQRRIIEEFRRCLLRPETLKDHADLLLL